MTKRFIGVFALVVVVATARFDSFPTEAAPPPKAGLAIGESFVVEPPMARYIRDLDERELREQVRDWAVIATVTRLGASPEQAAAATHELPSARLPYLEELYAFEYGSGRRAYLGGRVLLFRDGGDRDPQATIGRVADRVKMENGEAPSKAEIYLVHDQRDDGAIRIERAPDVSGSDLFSSKYGYVEGPANNLHELTESLGKIDDLSSAQIKNGRLTIGGRRFPNSPTAGATADDVAALYQAHEQFDAPRKPARAVLAKLPPGARKAAAQVRQLLETQAADEKLQPAVSLLERELASFPNIEGPAIIDAIKIAAQPARAPGFSLDPTWLPDPADPQHPLMLRRLHAFTAEPCGIFARIAKEADTLARAEPDDTRRTAHTRDVLRVRNMESNLFERKLIATECSVLKQLARQLDPVIKGLETAKPETWESELVRYSQLIAHWRSLPPTDQSHWAAGLVVFALGAEETGASAQCARYHGTAGTRVGMTMFYADALAKIWQSVDYGLSAPTAEIAGFMSTPRTNLDPTFLPDVQGNPGSRIWFGPRANGVSKSSRTDGSRFLFHHSFTSIYAAGNNPANPGHEERPAEDTRRTVSWWDRHYDDVANYEQEYHRLNQIMKWSLVTAALADSASGSYLGSAQVQNDLKFFDWQRANGGRLRFSEEIPMFDSSPPGRECMPLLQSYLYSTMGREWSIRGGVTAVPLSTPARVPVPDVLKPLGARRPYVGSLTGTTSGTAMRSHPELNGKVVRFVNAAGVPIRDLKGDVPLESPTVTYQKGTRAGSIAIRAGESKHSIGALEAEVSGKLHWKDGLTENQRHGVPALPQDLASAEKLAARGDVLTAAERFESLGALDSTLMGRARAVVVDAANLRPAQVLAKFRKLQGELGSLSPEGRNMVRNALKEVSGPRAKAYIDDAFQRRGPLDSAHGKLVTERGLIIVTRDIDRAPVKKLSGTMDLSTSEVYLDDRLRVGQEGYLPDLGGNVSRWQRRSNVRVEELDANVIGALPDQLVVKPASSASLKLSYIPPLVRSPPGVRPRVVIIRQCDQAQETVTTDDDC